MYIRRDSHHKFATEFPTGQCFGCHRSEIKRGSFLDDRKRMKSLFFVVRPLFSQHLVGWIDLIV